MRRLLVLSTFSMQPPVAGGQIRLYSLYNELSKKYKITLLSLAPHVTVNKPNENFIEYTFAPSNTFQKIVKDIQSKTKASSEDISSIFGYKYVPGLVEKFNSLKKETDIIVLTHPYLVNLASLSNKPKILDSFNVEYKLKYDLYEDKSYAELVKQAEHKAVKISDIIYPCSYEDKELLQKLYNVDENKFVVIENGVYTDIVGVNSLSEKIKIKEKLGFNKNDVLAVFIGSSYKPNVEALMYLIENVVPYVKNIKFLIIGSVGNGIISKYDNLKILGVLPEEEKNLYLKASDIGLNSVTVGSGSNVKMFEYLAAGLIILTTPIGARGIKNKPQSIIISQLDNFVENLNKIYNLIKTNNSDLEHLVNESIKTSKFYDWKNIANKLINKIEETYKK